MLLHSDVTTANWLLCCEILLEVTRNFIRWSSIMVVATFPESFKCKWLQKGDQPKSTEVRTLRGAATSFGADSVRTSVKETQPGSFPPSLTLGHTFPATKQAH